MSQPRQVLEGSTYFISRRTVLRHKLLRPDDVITNLIVYTLCVAAPRFGIHVHAFCVMSTHYHLVITDENGVLSDFLAFFNRIVALTTKVLRKWEGNLWDNAQTSAIRLTTRQAIVEAIAYTLANPVEANLVEYAHEWPGGKVLVDDLGRGVLRATLPDVYFSKKNPNWPKETALGLSLPPAIAAEDADDFRRDVAADLAKAENAARVARGKAKVLGATRAANVSPMERATSVEPLIGRNPAFATGSGSGGETFQQAVDALRAFRKSYRAALTEWRKGVRDILFPLGTWWMRVFHRACVCPGMPIA